MTGTENALAPHHTDPVYWDPQALRAESSRVFDICNGCRRCWNLCPSFGTLFKRLDQIDDVLNAAAGQSPAASPAGHSRPEGEGAHAAQADPSLASLKNPVEGLADADHEEILDGCYQCKLCYNHCPYHPPHRFQLDFPRLMQRAKAVSVAQGRGTFADKILAQTDVLGTLSSAAAPIVNALNRSSLFRALLERVLGIDHKRNLPAYHGETFRRWWDWRGPKARASGQVALFYTCSVNYNEPEIGRAAVQVLEANGFEVICPRQRCCGMPHLDGGDLRSAAVAARENVALLLPLAQRGVPIIALGPTCSYMLKEEYPALLKSDDARAVARGAYDIMEFLAGLKKKGRLNERFRSSPGRIAYQLPCHLKAQNMGLKTKEMLERLPATSVSVIDRCSAHDGTWAMKKENYALSMTLASKMFSEIEAAKPDAVSTDCPLAALQIVQGTGRSARHPVQILADAYGAP